MKSLKSLKSTKSLESLKSLKSLKSSKSFKSLKSLISLKSLPCKDNHEARELQLQIRMNVLCRKSRVCSAVKFPRQVLSKTAPNFSPPGGTEK